MVKARLEDLEVPMRGLAWLTLVLLAAGCNEYDLDNGPHTVTGPQPDIQVTPPVSDWGVKLPGCISDPKAVTIRNVGQGPLHVSNVTLSGDASAFTLTDAPTSEVTLASGESIDVHVNFLAGTTTPYDASFDVTSDDPDEGTASAELKGEGGNNPTNADTFTQPSPDAVDVLWVVDYSCSMQGVVDELASRFDEFIQSFVALGLDFQVGVTTSDMDPGGTDGHLLGDPAVLTSDMTPDEIRAQFDADISPQVVSNTEVVLGAAYASLQDPGYALDQGLIRPDANLAVIVIGDEDDQSGSVGAPLRSAAQYSDWINGYKADPDKATVSGIIPISTGGNIFNVDGCNDFMGLPKIKGTVDQTGGTTQNLCTLDQSFTNVMDWLSFTAAGLHTTFELSGTPAAGNAGITVTVNGQSVSMDPFRQDGWVYDPNTNSVAFYGSAIPGPSAEVVVTYPVEGSCSN